MEIEFKKLKDLLREKRKAAGLSQLQVSKAMGWETPQLVSNNERGVSTPPMKSINKLAKLYNIETREIAELMRAEEIKRVNKKFKNFL